MRKGLGMLRVVPLLAGACGGEPTGPLEELPRPLSAAEQQLVTAGNEFSFSLFRETISQTDASRNILLSPLSLATALGMAMNGAAGETETAMRSALGLRDLSPEETNASFRDFMDLLRNLDRGVDFRNANSIWARQGTSFEPEFLDVNRRYFDARMEALDFAAPTASATINAWVREETGGLIPSIVPDALPPDIVLYLINAVFFRGDWVDPFDRSRTTQAAFRLPNGDGVTVPMMTHGGAIRVRAARSASIQMLELPYARGAFGLIVLLPDESASLQSVVMDLTGSQWDEWERMLEPAEVQVHLPKFSLSDEVPLNDALDRLGMGVAFTDLADFTRISTAVDLAISEVKQKVLVEVDEEGTKAAASTVVSFFESGPTEIRVDRPFLFVLRERLSGTVLFIGRVSDPR